MRTPVHRLLIAPLVTFAVIGLPAVAHAADVDDAEARGAVEAVQAFSARLRQEMELERLNRETPAMVRETVQPAHVSLWLRSPGWEPR